jgi:hypothetical protein
MTRTRHTQALAGNVSAAVPGPRSAAQRGRRIRTGRLCVQLSITMVAATAGTSMNHHSSLAGIVPGPSGSVSQTPSQTGAAHGSQPVSTVGSTRRPPERQKRTSDATIVMSGDRYQ